MALEPPSNNTLDPIGPDGILDLLNEEDTEETKKVSGDEEEEEPKKKEDKEEEEEETPIGDEEEDEEKEIKLEKDEDELEIDEDKIDLIVPSRKKDILKEFPNLFKKFPDIEVALFRDRQFVEVFPTVEDAREAAENSKTLAKFEGELLQGNTEEILKLVKENDGEAFNKIVDDYLPSLGRIDPNARDHIISNVIKYTIAAMATRAQENEDQELLDHAIALNEYIFNTKKITAPRPLSTEKKNDESDTLKKERQSFIMERFETAQNDLQSRVDNVIKSTIDANIDPKGVMSAFVKKHATREAFDKLEELLIKDKQLESALNKLWRNWQEENFSRSSLEKIRSVYLSKARSLLSGVIKNARIEALKDRGKNSSSNENRRGHAPVGRNSSSESHNRGKTEIPKGMSNRDFIMSD